jgi:hypothetical protein
MKRKKTRKRTRKRRMSLTKTAKAKMTPPRRMAQTVSPRCISIRPSRPTLTPIAENQPPVKKRKTAGASTEDAPNGDAVAEEQDEQEVEDEDAEDGGDANGADEDADDEPAALAKDIAKGVDVPVAADGAEPKAVAAGGEE